MTMYIGEYSNMGLGGNAQAPVCPKITKQTIASGASAPFNSATRFIRLHSDAICSFAIGPPGTVATTTDDRMIAGATEYFFVSPGHIVYVVANS